MTDVHEYAACPVCDRVIRVALPSPTPAYPRRIYRHKRPVAERPWSVWCEGALDTVQEWTLASSPREAARKLKGTA